MFIYLVGVEYILPKMPIAWVECMNITLLQTERRQTDLRRHYSEREREFTFAKN